MSHCRQLLISLSHTYFFVPKVPVRQSIVSPNSALHKVSCNSSPPIAKGPLKRNNSQPPTQRHPDLASLTVTVKFTPLPAMKAEENYKYSATLPLTSAPDGVGGQRHVPALPPGKDPVPIVQEVGGPQGRSGRVR
jgi:hypothetical protein